MNQSTALQILQSGQNVFLTGSAGTGKTYVLNQFIAQMRAHGVALAVTASTGIAATHLGGQTIHSWSGMGIKDFFSPHDLDLIARKKKVRERIEQTKILMIDEISMISRNFLSNLDIVLQYIRLDNRPFGGIQVIFCGDFFQLPPVSRVRLTNAEKFSFMSPAWVDANLQVCYLTEQFRQNQDDLAHFLNEMRTGELSDARIDELYECMEQTRGSEAEGLYTRLYTHNADVDLINQRELKALTTKSKIFSAETKGNKTMIVSLKKSILAPDKLELKLNAPVMFVRNNPEKGYQNGTLGTVMKFSAEGFPVVLTRDDITIVVKPEEWRVDDIEGHAIAVYAQIPLRLAWAITVHKSQGMTLEQAEIDLSKTFEAGQGYVALSRVKSWSGLRLLGCNRQALAVAPLVLKADNRFQELSDEAETRITAIDETVREREFRQRILSLGGTNDPEKIEQNRASQAAKTIKKTAPKGATYDLTKKLVESKKTLIGIVKSRGMSEDTIIKHLSVLKAAHPDLDLEHLKPAPERLAEMLVGFEQAQKTANPEDRDKDGEPKLKYVFEVLNEKYFYRELKLARLFV